MRRWGWRATTVALVGTLLSTSGCLWPSTGANPDRTAHAPGETTLTATSAAAMTERWTAQTDEPGIDAGPVVSSAGVYVRTSAGLYGIDRATGARLWRAEPALDHTGANVPFGGPISVGPEGVVASAGYWTLNQLGHRQFFDPSTGSASPPTRDGYVHGRRGSILASVEELCSWGDCTASLRIQDLARDENEYAGLGYHADTRITLGIDAVYHVGAGAPYPFDENGVPLRSTVGVRAFPLSGIEHDCGSPLMDLSCPEWVTETDGAPTMVVIGPGEDTLYVGTDAGTVYAVAADDGTIVWTAAVGAPVTHTPALADGHLYVTADDGTLTVLDAATGAIEWTAPLGAPPSAQPAVAGTTDPVVFTTGTDGTIHAFAAHGCAATTCTPVWTTTTGSEITGAPAIALGQLYVGTADGRVIAYGPAT